MILTFGCRGDWVDLCPKDGYILPSLKIGHKYKFVSESGSEIKYDKVSFVDTLEEICDMKKNVIIDDSDVEITLKFSKHYIILERDNDTDKWWYNCTDFDTIDCTFDVAPIIMFKKIDQMLKSIKNYWKDSLCKNYE